MFFKKEAEIDQTWKSLFILSKRVAELEVVVKQLQCVHLERHRKFKQRNTVYAPHVEYCGKCNKELALWTYAQKTTREIELMEKHLASKKSLLRRTL